MKIYLASSWKNTEQPDFVGLLRSWDYEVYDFRNPKPDEHGFHWAEIDPEWESWKPERYIEALGTPLAEAGFKLDWDGMNWAECCVLLLPCGRSAHLEAGWFVGAGRPVVAIALEPTEPELMYKMLTATCSSLGQLQRALEVLDGE